MMSKKLLQLSLLSAAISIAAVSTAATARNNNDWNLFSNHFMTKSVSSIENNIELLFVENALHGYLAKDPHKPGCAILTLSPVANHIEYFTDEPVRLSGDLSPERFVKMWSKQDKQDGTPFVPNVELEGIEMKHGKMVGTYHASAAVGDAKYDAKHDSMHYYACPLKGEPALTTPLSLEHVSVFFDQFTIWPPTT